MDWHKFYVHRCSDLQDRGFATFDRMWFFAFIYIDRCTYFIFNNVNCIPAGNRPYTYALGIIKMVISRFRTVTNQCDWLFYKYIQSSHHYHIKHDYEILAQCAKYVNKLCSTYTPIHTCAYPAQQKRYERRTIWLSCGKATRKSQKTRLLKTHSAKVILSSP